MYPGNPPVAVHETHASVVFVAGESAYKIKKPVSLGFLDYGTLELRRRACNEEVRVNAELAPGIYLGVVAISPARAGFRIASEQAPDAVEYAVQMRSFRERDTLMGMIDAGAVNRGHIAELARLLAEFHRRAERVQGWGPEQVIESWLRNVRELALAGPPARWALDVAASFGEVFVESREGEIGGRADAGLARDGHGDLRCEHILMEPSLYPGGGPHRVRPRPAPRRRRVRPGVPGHGPRGERAGVGSARARAVV
jgi:aminoglycoside phosphotransferase family enzyme